MERLEEALDAWRDALGAEHVLVDTGTREAAERATFATTQRVPAVLRPGSRGGPSVPMATLHAGPCSPVTCREQLRLWLAGAGAHGKCAAGAGADEPGAGVGRGAGLPHGGAGSHLRPGARLPGGPSPGCSWPPSAGRPRRAWWATRWSEGTAAGPTGTSSSTCAIWRWCCPRGSCCARGWGATRGPRRAAVLRWGTGPGLDGLFSQSNLGVVTRMTFWLAPRAPCVRIVSAPIEDAAQREAVVDRLRLLRLEGTLREASRCGTTTRCSRCSGSTRGSRARGARRCRSRCASGCARSRGWGCGT